MSRSGLLFSNISAFLMDILNILLFEIVKHNLLETSEKRAVLTPRTHVLNDTGSKKKYVRQNKVHPHLE